MHTHQSTIKLALRHLATCGAILGLLGCGGLPRVPFTPTLQLHKKPAPDTLEMAPEKTGGVRDKLTTSTGPAPPLGRESAEPVLATTPPHLTGEPVGGNFEGIRLPAFINTVFGEILKVTFEIDNSIM